MATKEQIFNVLSAASGPLSRVQIEEKVGEDFRKYQTQFNRWLTAGLIEDKGDHHYVLTEKGREETLERGEFKDVDSEPGLQQEELEESEVSLGTTEYQQFLKFGKRVGVTPLALIKLTADHVWDGGDYKDLKWVAQAMQEMGIMQDLRARWFNRWRSYLKQGLPTDLPSEFFPSEHKREAEKEKGAGKRDYILSEDDSPIYVGEGLGDLDYKDALDLAKLRTSRRKETPQIATAGSMADEITKIFRAFKETMGEKAEGKSYVVRPSEGGYQVEEVEPNKPLVLPSPEATKQQGSYFVDSDGSVKELAPGQPVVIMKEPPRTPQPPSHYLIDKNTGEMKEVAPGQPVIIIRESAPVSQVTPIQIKDRDGNPMVLDLSTFIKLEEHRDKQRRDEESHQVKMDIAKEFKGMLKKASAAAARTIEDKEGEGE